MVQEKPHNRTRKNLVLTALPAAAQRPTDERASLSFSARLSLPLNHSQSGRAHRRLRVLASAAALLLLPPFIVVAVAPMLLVLVPVAMVGIPFIVPALFSGSRAAYLEHRRSLGFRAAPRPTLVLS